jgi:pyruvate formate lyase activating enzyme
MAVIHRDSAYWGPGGGVTLGGGDPLAQPAFARNILRRCRDRYIHTAIETSACFPFEQFLETVTLADWLFIDVKHLSSDAHQEATGAGNEMILDNIRRLKESGWPGRLVIRVPVVPGFNDSPETIGAIARFAASAGWGEMNLLPFHRMGASKYGQLGLAYAYADVPPPGEELMRSLQQAAEAGGVTCYCGASTPF